MSKIFQIFNKVSTEINITTSPNQWEGKKNNKRFFFFLIDSFQIRSFNLVEPFGYFLIDQTKLKNKPNVRPKNFTKIKQKP